MRGERKERTATRVRDLSHLSLSRSLMGSKPAAGRWHRALTEVLSEGYEESAETRSCDGGAVDSLLLQRRQSPECPGTRRSRSGTCDRILSCGGTPVGRKGSGGVQDLPHRVLTSGWQSGGTAAGTSASPPPESGREPHGCSPVLHADPHGLGMLLESVTVNETESPCHEKDCH